MPLIVVTLTLSFSHHIFSPHKYFADRDIRLQQICTPLQNVVESTSSDMYNKLHKLDCCVILKEMAFVQVLFVAKTIARLSYSRWTRATKR